MVGHFSPPGLGKEKQTNKQNAVILATLLDTRGGKGGFITCFVLIFLN